MSKRGYISRYLLILKKLKVKPYSTYEELQAYIDSQANYLQMQDDTLQIGFSRRTLQRDIREIRTVFGIDIEYSKSLQGYYLTEANSGNMNFERMVEAFDMFNSLKLAQDLTPFIHLEKRRPEGTENLNGLVYSIKNKYQVRFEYENFWEEATSKRKVEPYALKEFRYRWYVIARDDKEGKVKSFALDRISDLEITRQKFNYPAKYNVEQAYRHSFGIINPTDEEPEEIILSFDPFQGKYIKSLPLHETQEIIDDNDKELVIKLTLCITHDLVMELLSYGHNMKVVKPESLITKIKTAHEKAFRQY